MRRLAVVLTSLLAVACGGDKDKSATPPPPPKQEVSDSTARKPAPPPMSGYDKARRVALGVLARPIDPAAVHLWIENWDDADAAVRRLGRDARSGEVAMLLVEGAAEDPRNTSKATRDEWRAIAALIIAVVLEDAARDRRGEAGARLNAIATLGADINDRATIGAAARACVVVATGAPDDAALAKTCAALAKLANPTP